MVDKLIITERMERFVSTSIKKLRPTDVESTTMECRQCGCRTHFPVIVYQDDMETMGKLLDIVRGFVSDVQLLRELSSRIDKILEDK